MTQKSNFVKQKCIEQSMLFKKWDQQQKYDLFHSNHYDWWTFPLNRPSGHGNKYRLFPEDLKELYYDQQFIQALRTNSILCCKSWGFDLIKGSYIEETKEHQSWQCWPIRLYKLANSLFIFYQDDLLENAIAFGNDLIDKEQDFTYGPKDLKPFFRQNRKQTKKQEKIEKTEEVKSQAKLEEKVLKTEEVESQAKLEEKINYIKEEEKKEVKKESLENENGIIMSRQEEKKTGNEKVVFPAILQLTERQIEKQSLKEQISHFAENLTQISE